MKTNIFIGTGHNPNGPDLPLGFGMRLAQHPSAMEAFGKMTSGQKSDLISGIQGASTGEEAEKRMNDAIERLDKQCMGEG